MKLRNERRRSRVTVFWCDGIIWCKNRASSLVETCTLDAMRCNNTYLRRIELDKDFDGSTKKT